MAGFLFCLTAVVGEEVGVAEKFELKDFRVLFMEHSSLLNIRRNSIRRLNSNKDESFRRRGFKLI